MNIHRVIQHSTLVMLTVALAGCASTPVAPEAQQSVQAQGSKVSPEPAATSLFAQQHVNWQNCQLPFAPSADCGTVKAPVNWFESSGGQLDVAVLKVPASDPARRRGILLVNPGGPGGEGRRLAAYLAMAAPELAKVYDIVGFDPRGVGGSTNLNCILDVDFTKSYTQQELARIVAQDCQKNPLAAHVNTEQTVRDMDLIRAVLGEEKTSYLGYSYGTWLGAWYAARFPNRVDRFVLDSNVDTRDQSLQNTFQLQPMARERAVTEGFFAWLSRSVKTGALPYASDMPLEALELRARYEQFPPQLKGELRSMILMGLYNPQMFPFVAMTFDMANGLVQTNAQGGNEVTREQLRAEVLARMQSADFSAELRGQFEQDLKFARQNQAGKLELYPLDASNSTFFAVTCNDGKYTPSGNYWEQFARRATQQWPFAGELYGMQPCAYWPASFSFPKVQPGNFPAVLMVQSEMDSATPLEGARRTRQHLPGAKMVTVDNEFAHGIYPYSDSCVDATVEAYLLRGQMPDSDVVCGALPLPLETTVYEVGGHVRANGKVQQLRQHPASVREARTLVKNLVHQSTSQGDPIQ